jgi:hypothetical protein
MRLSETLKEGSFANSLTKQAQHPEAFPFIA